MIEGKEQYVAAVMALSQFLIKGNPTLGVMYEKVQLNPKNDELINNFYTQKAFVLNTLIETLQQKSTQSEGHS
jgi:flagellar basal body-associated protein FliL